MHITEKDKSLILLLAASLIIVWAMFSVASHIFFSLTFSNSDVAKIVKGGERHWFNLSKSLKTSDLEDRVILLNFWSYDCAICDENADKIRNLEEKFGSKLTVIGVHTKNINDGKGLSSIRKAILKHDFTHPIINDSDLKIKNDFRVKSVPSLILIDPRGKIIKTFSGEISGNKLENAVKNLISKFKYQINRDALPIALERYKSANNVLDFPSKLEYGQSFSYKSRSTPAIFVADSGHNQIIVSSLTGEIIVTIGSGDSDLKDGDFNDAAFNNPRGMAYNAGKLYVADSGNNALRVIDFSTNKVKTLTGAGKAGAALKGDEKKDAKKLNLSSPSDIEFFPQSGVTKDSIAIANSGNNQILLYNLKNDSLSVLAGSGSEGGADGKYPNNSLAQTSDLAHYNRKLYFVDAASSALRVVDEHGEVKTLVSGGQSLSHPFGLIADDTGIYIADTFNNSIQKYNFSSGQINRIIGSRNSGDGIGATTQFDQPSGIISILDRFYIADTNNNRIVIASRAGGGSSEILDIIPPLKLPKEKLSEYQPNPNQSQPIEINADQDIIIKISIKPGWKINEEAPSFINLLEITKRNRANLIDNFDWQMIRAQTLKLPNLKDSKVYALQGTIYYCEDKKNALCYVENFDHKIIPVAKSKKAEIDLKVGY